MNNLIQYDKELGITKCKKLVGLELYITLKLHKNFDKNVVESLNIAQEQGLLSHLSFSDSEINYKMPFYKHIILEDITIELKNKILNLLNLLTSKGYFISNFSLYNLGFDRYGNLQVSDLERLFRTNNNAKDLNVKINKSLEYLRTDLQGHFIDTSWL